VKGECRGRIAFEEKGKNGFGYDPVFIPNGFSKTYAELLPAAKNKISHRGRALRKAKALILKYLS
jgi:XTP/dITP diphosphohydrolase